MALHQGALLAQCASCAVPPKPSTPQGALILMPTSPHGSGSALTYILMLLASQDTKSPGAGLAGVYSLVPGPYHRQSVLASRTRRAHPAKIKSNNVLAARLLAGAGLAAGDCVLPRSCAAPWRHPSVAQRGGAQ